MPNGLPTEDELVFARTLDVEMDRIVGKDGLHAMIRTGDGGRTIYYYVANVDPIRDSVRKFFDAAPPISVIVSVRQDRRWSAVREVLEAIRR